jgi:ubiquitin carboxyl-terminal hydrolase 5/13
MAFGGANNDDDDKENLFVRIVKSREAKKTGSIEKLEGEEETMVDNIDTSGLEAKVTKLGMGVDGGFQSPDDAFEVVTKYSVVLLQSSQNKTVSKIVELDFNEETKNDFPMNVTASVDSIIHHAGEAVQQDLKAWELDDEKVVSKYLESLEFLDNGVKISPNPSDWKVSFYK